jgi:hypothetical protein
LHSKVDIVVRHPQEDISAAGPLDCFSGTIRDDTRHLYDRLSTVALDEDLALQLAGG